MTDANGVISISGMQPGSYVVTVKNRHTLRNRKTGVVMVLGANIINLGTLLEGDANDDNTIDIADYSIMVASLGTCMGNPSFDSRADFNEDGCVNSVDYSLLLTNFSKSGDQPVPMPALSAHVKAGSQASISIEPGLVIAAPGTVFTVTVVVDAASSTVDAAEAHLDFDPARLEVVDQAGAPAVVVTDGGVLVGLVNHADNSHGTIDYIAGAALPPAPPAAGRFVLASLRFKALTFVSLTELDFVISPQRQTNVVSAGQSILGELRNGRMRLVSALEMLPVIIKE